RPWSVAGKTLAEIEESAKEIRNSPAIDLVLVAVPLAVTPDATPTEPQIWSFSWILNHSLAFGKQEWDVVVVAPSVTGSKLTANSAAREEFTRQMVRAQDLTLIAREETEVDMTSEAILVRWLKSQGTRD
ncbi:MAG: lysophospholipase, partial [Planctomycetota bacterium]|nr:lysophospholipase [Planctomycetota bacterium]